MIKQLTRATRASREKVNEHAGGFRRIASSHPRSLAFTLGLLSCGWGLSVTLIPTTWEAPIYATLVYFLPASFVGIPMVASGLVQIAAATNGIMLSRIAQVAIILQACIWGAVACTAAVSAAPSTGTTIYSVLAFLSLLLFWQWQSAARREGKLPPP